MRSRGHLESAVAGLLLVCLGACESQPPHAPDAVSDGRQPNGSPEEVLALTIEGPGEVAPGQSVRFTATARMRDQSERDVTTQAVWSVQSIFCASCPPDPFSVAPGGLVTAFTPGEGTVFALLGNVGDEQKILAVPPGTYRIAGTVKAAVAPHYPVADVQVTVESTTGTKQSVVTDPDGTYRLYGVRGDVSLAAAKAGFEPRRERINVTSHRTVDLPIRPSHAPPDLSGTYTLTIRAAADCTDVPEALRVRRYTATITQTGAGLTVSLSGSHFMAAEPGSPVGTFTGTVEPDAIRFTLTPLDRWDCCSYPDVIEWTETAQYLVIDGKAELTRGSTLSGLLEGALSVVDELPNPGWALPESTIICFSRHRMTFSR